MSAQVDLEIRVTLSRPVANDAEADEVGRSVAKWLNGHAAVPTRGSSSRILITGAEVTDWTDVDRG